MIYSFTDFNMYIPANAIVFWWICGIAVSLDDSVRPESRSTQIDEKQRRVIRYSGFTLACVTVIYSVAWLLFFHGFDSDKQAERIFCRFGVCDPTAMMNIDSATYGKTLTMSSNELIERLRRDPAAPNRWEDLGDALQRDGRTSSARDLFPGAILGPNLPFIFFSRKFPLSV